MPAPRYVQTKESSPRRGGGRMTTSQTPVGPKPTPLPHDPRLIYTFAAAMGRRVTVQVKSGVLFEGTLYGPLLGSKNIHITLKNAKRLDEGDQEAIETLVIPSQEFVQMQSSGIPFGRNKENGIQSKTTEETKTESTEEKVEYEVMAVRDENDMSGFMGDVQKAAASGNNNSVGRELVAWNGGDPGEELELRGDTKGWCQFSDQANAGVESTFNMDAYTSKLDLKNSRYTEEDADRIAREIEAEQKARSSTLDDSGVFDEETPPLMPVMASVKEAETPKTMLRSFADAVKKGKTTPQPNSGHVTPKYIESQGKTTDIKEAEIPDPRPVAPQFDLVKEQPVSRPMPAVYDNSSSFQDKSEGLYPYKASEPVFLKKTDPMPSTFGEEKGQLPMFGTISYELTNALQSNMGEHTGSGFGGLQEKSMEPTPPPAPYYRDPVWGMNASHPPPVRSQVPQVDAEPPSQTFEIVHEHPAASPTMQKELKKTTSAVVPGISFRDKLKANLPNKPIKPSTPATPATPSQTKTPVPTRTPTRSQPSFDDPTKETIVQTPPSGRAYSRKLISNPKRNQLHSVDAGRGLPSEEHLLSPIPIPHPMMYPPPADMHPPMMIPPYEMERQVHGPYGGYPSPMDLPAIHPVARPSPYGHQQEPASPGSEREGENEGRVGRRFQLNPMAKAFKPPSEHETYPAYSQPPPVDYRAPRTPPGEVIPPIQQPPTAPPQHTPKHPTGPGEAMPVEYVGTPPAPHGARPPYIQPSNVVTPWPSFPGTGVWHSGLGTPRPGTPQANAMMNGFMSPPMPAPFPVLMPGMPPPFVPGMQHPMWRPSHIRDQNVAMMWGNYYGQMMPPNKRMWNQKFPGAPGPMPRPVRNHRRPSNEEGQSPGTYPVPSPARQQSGEMA